MMRKMESLAATIVVALMWMPTLEAQVSKTPNKADASSHGEVQVDPQNIRAHVKFLASDLLEGRGTGQRGGDIAADYIATQFALYGLTPAGDEGTYFQNVPMVAVKTLDETSFNFVAPDTGAVTLKNLEDFVTSNESKTETAFIDAPIVFAGYGIRAPEYNWDDYKDADLTGKVALLFLNEPASDDPKFFKGKTLTYYGGSGLQVRGDGSARGNRDADHSPRGSGRLQLGCTAEFLGEGAILPAAGHQTEIAGSFVDPVRGSEKTCCDGRARSGQAV